MWSPLALRPPRSVAPARTSRGHQSARFGGIWTPTSGISRRLSAMSRSMSATVTSVAHSGRGRSGGAPLQAGGGDAGRPLGRRQLGRRADAGPPVGVGGLGGDVGGLLAVVAP